MSKERDVASICARVAELEAERSELNEQLVRLEAKRGQEKVGSPSDSPLTVNSTATEKIALFRRLFAGRPDVFPVRWENRNTGKSGYAPACANEWKSGRQPSSKTPSLSSLMWLGDLAGCINHAPTDHGLHNLDVRDLLGGDIEEVAIEHDEIGEFAGLQG